MYYDSQYDGLYEETSEAEEARIAEEERRAEEERQIEQERQRAADEAYRDMKKYGDLSNDIHSGLNKIREKVNSVQMGLETIDKKIVSYPDSGKGRFAVLFGCACGRFEYDEKEMMNRFNDKINSFQDKLNKIDNSFNYWQEEFQKNC